MINVLVCAGCTLVAVLVIVNIKVVVWGGNSVVIVRYDTVVSVDAGCILITVS